MSTATGRYSREHIYDSSIPLIAALASPGDAVLCPLTASGCMLQAWLNKLGLPQYYDLFHEHHFGYDLLHTLTDEVSIGF